MAGEALGHKSYMQFVREATYGTGIAATRRAPLISADIELTTGQILDPSLDDSVSRTAIYQGRRGVNGSIRTRIDYEMYGLWWDCLFGTASFGSVGAATTGVGPYVHTFKELSILNSLTVQLVEGNIPAAKCSRLLGLKVEGATLRCQQGEGEQGLATVEWAVAAKDYEEDITPTAALSAPTPLPVLFHEATTWEDGSGDAAAVRMRSFELSIRNPVEKEGVIGQTTIEEPIRNNFLEVGFRSTKLYKTKAAHTRARAFTNSPVEVVFGSAATKRMTLEMDTAKIRSHRKPVGGYGLILETNEIVPSKDATLATAVQLKMENGLAAASMF